MGFLGDLPHPPKKNPNLELLRAQFWRKKPCTQYRFAISCCEKEEKKEIEENSGGKGRQNLEMAMGTGGWRIGADGKEEVVRWQ